MATLPSRNHAVENPMTAASAISPRRNADQLQRPSGHKQRRAWWLSFLIVAMAQGQEPEPIPVPEAEIQTLRERLTEREDETRVENPFTVKVLGRPLELTGQYEVSLDAIGRLTLGDPAERFRQLLLEQQIEGEAFYVVAPSLSLFAQARLTMEHDLDSSTPERLSDLYIERGEMWVFVEGVAGLPFSVEVGRLNFEDDRRWWWDEDLDAVKVSYEGDPLSVDLSLARELFSARSDRNYVQPEHAEVLRLIGEATWDWRENQVFELFTLYHNDQSRTERPGGTVRREREDESDAELFWAGLRASGAQDFVRAGLLGYWFDTGAVFGKERLLTLEEISSRRSEVASAKSQSVRGWALDGGLTWVFPAPAEPRISFGYARGSGDGNPGDDTDHSFRQTGLHGNEPGFGGVQRFRGYGRLLDPELSNLSILTAGLGCSLFGSSSLDLVFHDYRLVELAESLRDARIETSLTGQHRALGQSIDLELAVEEWSRIEFEVAISAFRAGPAFGPERNQWIFGGFAAMRVAF